MQTGENKWVYHQFQWADDTQAHLTIVLNFEGKRVYHPYLSHNREDHQARNLDTPVMIGDQLSAQIMCMEVRTQHNLSR